MPQKREVKERFDRIETEARKLARSGQHRWSSSIEMALLAQGYRDTPRVFANRWTQYELDRLCELATHARGGAAAA
jgi:hypothetical protein